MGGLSYQPKVNQHKYTFFHQLDPGSFAIILMLLSTQSALINKYENSKQENLLIDPPSAYPRHSLCSRGSQQTKVSLTKKMDLPCLVIDSHQ